MRVMLGAQLEVAVFVCWTGAGAAVGPHQLDRNVRIRVLGSGEPPSRGEHRLLCLGGCLGGHEHRLVDYTAVGYCTTLQGSSAASV